MRAGFGKCLEDASRGLIDRDREHLASLIVQQAGCRPAPHQAVPRSVGRASVVPSDRSTRSLGHDWTGASIDRSF
jgi:hypothetical protein